MSWHRADRPGVPGMEGKVNIREGLNYTIERKEMDRLSKAHPDLRWEAIRDVFHAGFGFGFCEGSASSSGEWRGSGAMYSCKGG